jgi:hypothetical protein
MVPAKVDCLQEEVRECPGLLGAGDRQHQEVSELLGREHRCQRWGEERENHRQHWEEEREGHLHQRRAVAEGFSVVRCLRRDRLLARFFPRLQVNRWGNNGHYSTQEIIERALGKGLIMFISKATTQC